MKHSIIGVLLLVLTACTQVENPVSTPEFSRVGQAQSVIVTLKSEANPRAIAALLGINPSHVYEHALKGFAARVDGAQEQRLRNHPMVRTIEPDGIVTVQAPASWGLDRIDQRTRPLDGTYTPPHNGAGVRVYILDTGIRMSHVEFGGRAVSGWDFIDNDADASDCHGHGTHVAGTVGGTTVGVANGVTLVSVRVLSCTGSGTYAQVIAGIDWVTANAIQPAVANMSLGGGFSQAANDAVTGSIAAGVVYAISAGNSSGDACRYSPASTPNALTIGATDQADSRASFSNFGSCVDLFAPGVAIVSAEALCTTESCYSAKNGTSMAAPHVAGVAAIYRALNPAATAEQTNYAVTAFATRDVVVNPGSGSPNRLLYSQVTGTPPPLPPPPPPPSTSMHVGDIDSPFTWTYGKSGQPSGYTTWIRVWVHGADHTPIPGTRVQVRYTLRSGLTVVRTSTITLTSGTDGQAWVYIIGQDAPKTKGKYPDTWVVTVEGLSFTGVPYLAGSNHDPDGDSNGTTLTRLIPWK